MSDPVQTQINPEQLERLNEFGKRYMELKAYFLKLQLQDQENVRLAIERLDDGFLRGREAIFSPAIVQEYEDEKAANDPVVPDQTPLAATH